MHVRFIAPLVATLIPVVLQTAASAADIAARSPGDWSISGSLTARVSHDSNVFVRNDGVGETEGSFVSTIMPVLSAARLGEGGFKASLSLSPEFTAYHSAHGEDHVTYRGTANLSGRSERSTWEWLNAITLIDGSDLGPFVVPGGAVPAVGGLPLRDRRDAWMLRHGVKLAYREGPWLVRPLLSAYVHDFGTEQHASTGEYAGYMNYVDRNEVTGGLDLGYEAGKELRVLLGYRYGRQHQSQLLGVSSLYSNTYHRVLAGVEGAITSRLKVEALVGPDWRTFDPNPNPRFDRDEVLLFVDVSATWAVSARDNVTLSIRRFEQPAFTSHSIYEDVVYAASWKCQVTRAFHTTLGLRGYKAHWQPPVLREDWIVTPSVSAAWTVREGMTCELSYLYDRARSLVPDTTTRDYDRHVGALGMKFVF